MAKPQGTCVYCGRFDVTKQHVWPDWLVSVLPRDESSNSQQLIDISSPTAGLTVIRPQVVIRRGDPGARKIRNVCGQCNSGWMSRLESAAKPLLTELILGRQVTLDTNAQCALAAWVTMFCITAEYTDRDHRGIPAADRAALMTSSRPPESWRIFIGRYRGTEWARRYAHCGFIFQRNNGANALCGAAQCSTFVVGELAVYACSASIPDADIARYLAPADDVALKQIWPPIHAALDSHAADIHGDVALQTLAQKVQLELAHSGLTAHGTRVLPAGLLEL